MLADYRVFSERNYFMNFLRKIYPKNFKRVILALILIMAVTTISMGAVYDVALKNVTLIQIDDFNGVNTNDEVKTRKLTVGEFLEEKEIVIGENDFVSMEPEAQIADGDVLIIRKGRIVELTADGEVQIVTVTKATVGEALEEIGVTLSEEDIVTPDKGTLVENEMSINVDRVSTKEVVETVEIEFATKKVNDSSLQKGKTKVSQKGEKGIKSVKYLVTTKNGEEISKELVSEEITKEPVSEIIKVGTKKVTSSKKSAKAKTTSVQTGKSKAKDFSYSRKITAKATAYDCSLAENGGNTKTAYGLTPQYGIVAVDPNVIPLGTKLYIESSDGGKSWVYGYCIAGDTGGAIKGNRIDVYFDNHAEALNFGVQHKEVFKVV